MHSDCQVACSCANETFWELHDKILCGDVTLNELKLIGENKLQVEKLYEAAIVGCERMEKTSYEVLQKSLRELEMKRQALLRLCNMIPDSVQGKLL